MVRRSRERQEETVSDVISDIAQPIAGIYILFLLIFWFGDRTRFWWLLVYGFVAVALIVGGIYFTRRFFEERKKQRSVRILDAIRAAGLEEHIKNFISRFGLGQEKGKNFWERRGYKIGWDRIRDLQNFLQQKGIDLSLSDINILLSRYIDEREFEMTAKSIDVTTQFFSKLNGSDFERLLYRLYESMGYAVQPNGRTGDQGGDLIAVKDQERLSIQAKCWKNSVGNGAVQEAAAARSHYDCNKAIVITNSTFTKEAIALAKTNGVELVSREVLRKMLLDNLKESWN